MKSYVSLKSKYEARKIYRKIGICPKRFDSPMSCACFHIGVFGLHYGLFWGCNYFRSVKFPDSCFFTPSDEKYLPKSSTAERSLYSVVISADCH